METATRQHKVVYTIVTRQRDGRKFWLRIGAAFPNRDGSLNVQLDAMPTNGQLQIRDYQPFDDSRGPRRHLEPAEEAPPEVPRELLTG